MPISDCDNYEEGHFNRVYEHLIIPACKKAGFHALRADDVMNTNYIALDVIKHIVESEMVICDISSQNPNVLYELGIRQAFNKPVALIKDRITNRIFDIQGFRDFEYDENLRIDNVENQVDKLSDIIKATYEEKDDVNSLISLLAVSSAKIEKETVISNDTKLILNSISGIENRISAVENISRKEGLNKKAYFDRTGAIMAPKKSDFPEGVGDFYSSEELNTLVKGDLVYHFRFGYGEVLKTDFSEGESPLLRLEIDFSGYGIKKLMAKFARLRKVK